MKRSVIALLALALLILPATAFAADAAAIFDAKCKACHGADGTKLAKANLATNPIQAKPEADIVKFLTTDAKHKTKVADEATAKALAAFIKTLKK